MSEIREHIRRAKDDPTTENLETMWRAVFGLPAWYLMPAATEEGPTTPMVAELDDGRWLLVFTDIRSIHGLARETGRVHGDSEVDLLTLSPAETTERVREVSDHVTGVCFNLGTDRTFRAPVEAFLRFAETL